MFLRSFDYSTHLLLIPRCRTGSQNVILDTTCCQMIQHGVVWHDQHAAVILHWCGSVQDALAHEHRQRRWLRELRDSLRGTAVALIFGRVVEIDVQEVLRDLIRVLRTWELLLGLRLRVLMVLVFE